MDPKPESSQPVPRQITIEILSDDMMTSTSPVKLISLPANSAASKVVDFRQITMVSNVLPSGDAKPKDKIHQLTKPGGVIKAKTQMSKVITKEMIANAKEVFTIKKEDLLPAKDSPQKTYAKELPKVTTLRPILPKTAASAKLFDANEDSVPLRIKQVSRVGSSGISEKVNVIEVLPKAQTFTPTYKKVTASSSTQAVSSPSFRGRRKPSRKPYYAYVTESESEGEEVITSGGRLKKYSKGKSKKSSDAEIVDEKEVRSARKSKRESLSQKLAEWGLLPKGQGEEEDDAEEISVGPHTSMSIKPVTSKQARGMTASASKSAAKKRIMNEEEDDDEDDDDEPEVPGPPPKFIKVSSSNVGLKPSLTTGVTTTIKNPLIIIKPDETVASSMKTITLPPTLSSVETTGTATDTPSEAKTSETTPIPTTISHVLSAEISLKNQDNDGLKGKKDEIDMPKDVEAEKDEKDISKDIRTIMDLDDLLSGLQESKPTASTAVATVITTKSTATLNAARTTTHTPTVNIKSANVKSLTASAQQVRPKPVSSATPSSSSMKSVATSTASSAAAATVKPSPAITPTSTKAATNSLWIKKASSMLAPSMHNKTGVTPVKKVDTMNKSLMCKPIMLTKATACNPMRIHKSTQTDEEVIEHKKTTVVPIPVPVLMPAPITPCVIPSPYPMPTPVPVPVPCIIPATRKNVQLLMKGLQDLYNKSITNPLEAELLDMAEVICSTKSEEDIQNEAYNATIIRGVNDQNYIYPGTTPSSYHKYQNGEGDVLEMAMRVVADMPEDQTGATNISKARVPGYLESSRSEMAMMSNFSSRGGPTKRASIYNSSQQLPLPYNESKVKLKYSYALKAWRSWTEQKNHDNSKTAGASRGRVRFYFDPDPLKLSYEELNAALSMFVRDVRKPTGEKYAPDSIYYMCLGLQYYLRENGRQDNIFFDVPYQKFTDVLNELMSAFELRLNTENMLICRVIEEHLWESKQLGCHTPQTLLNSLIYFNTKHFLLDSVDAHMNLSFAAIERGSDKTSDGQVVRKITLKQAVSFRELKTLPEQEYTQHELPDDPARCPVKLFDFYLSRCPEMIRHHSRLFYLTPELSSRPENPIWFSAMALSRGALNKMVNRVKVVREIQVARLEHMQFEA